uniref:Uncharacterized protein n=1 Tax=Oryza barthii TaxID=65489 RepID=A0A0D3GSG2_9ORYZ
MPPKEVVAGGVAAVKGYMARWWRDARAEAAPSPRAPRRQRKELRGRQTAGEERHAGGRGAIGQGDSAASRCLWRGCALRSEGGTEDSGDGVQRTVSRLEGWRGGSG